MKFRHTFSQKCVLSLYTYDHTYYVAQKLWQKVIKQNEWFRISNGLQCEHTFAKNSSPFPALENNCEAWHFGIARIVVNAYFPFDDAILLPLYYEKYFRGYEIDSAQLEDK